MTAGSMVPDAPFEQPGVALKGSRAPDRVLILGATGHVGRVFLEQGLEMFGKDVEFRVLLRNQANAADFGSSVCCVPGDVTDVHSIRRGCDGFTERSLIFDSCTSINLAYTDEDGSIRATNLEGPRNVITVAREFGVTLHKAHSMAGLACPRSGSISEDTPSDRSQEEAIYATLPYTQAKKMVTQDLLQAQADGLRAMVTYLVTPWGPYSRADALVNNVVATSIKLGRYFYPRDVRIVYVDARDAAKLHWLAWMSQVHDHVIMSAPLTQEKFATYLSEAAGKPLKMTPLSFPMMKAVGKGMDWLKRVFRSTEFPLSEAIAYLMFANNDYDTSKAERLFDFRARPTKQTFADHFQDMSNRGLIPTPMGRRAVSIW